MTSALETITPTHQDFHQISIHFPEHDPLVDDPANIGETFGDPLHRQWVDLDWLLVKFWELRGIRPKVLYETSENQKEAIYEYIGCWFPEVTERRIIELVDLSV